MVNSSLICAQRRLEALCQYEILDTPREVACDELASLAAEISETPIAVVNLIGVGLPGGLSGRQVASAARQIRPGLMLLFITGDAENAVLKHGHIERGMEVLTKPFSIQDLKVWVDRM